MAASASQSQSSTTTNTVDTQGSAGAGSPTIAAQGNVTYNPPEVSEAAINAAYATVLAALQGNTNLNTQVAQQGAQLQDNSTQLIQSLLQGEQQFAAASTPAATNSVASAIPSSYLLYGGLGLGAVLLVILLTRK